MYICSKYQTMIREVEKLKEETHCYDSGWKNMFVELLGTRKKYIQNTRLTIR